jgi:hypothetical protein
MLDLGFRIRTPGRNCRSRRQAVMGQRAVAATVASGIGQLQQPVTAALAAPGTAGHGVEVRGGSRGAEATLQRDNVGTFRPPTRLVARRDQPLDVILSERRPFGPERVEGSRLERRETGRVVNRAGAALLTRSFDSAPRRGLAQDDGEGVAGASLRMTKEGPGPRGLAQDDEEN